MTTEDIKNKIEKGVGKVKEEVGDLIDNEELEAKGKLQQAKADIKENVEETKETLKEKIEEGKETIAKKFNDTVDKIKNDK